MSRAEVWFVLKVVGVVALAGLVWAALPGCEGDNGNGNGTVEPQVCLNEFEAFFEGPQEGGLQPVKCGGPGCDPCPDFLHCEEDSGCQSGVCQSHGGPYGLCLPAHCGNQVRDAGEADVDCGWAVDCFACFEGQRCERHGDCSSGRCFKNVCVGQDPEYCYNGQANFAEGETGIDCGGPCVEGCPAHGWCGEDSDCESLNCVPVESGDNATMICFDRTCHDGTLNGTETDVDCGGGCGHCRPGEACRGDLDCNTLYCLNGICQEVGRDLADEPRG